jgi:hypothetical protein
MCEATAEVDCPYAAAIRILTVAGRASDEQVAGGIHGFWGSLPSSATVSRYG